MVRMTTAPAMWRIVRAGNLRARLRANRDGVASLRLNVGGAAVRTGLLEALADGRATTGELAVRLSVVDANLLGAFLRVVTAAGLIRNDGRDGPWRLTDRGRAVVADDLVRAAYEAFSGFHTGLYRELGPLLAGGPARRDVADEGELIARVAASLAPLVLATLTGAVAQRRPRRVLDIGCGAGLELAAMVEAAPGAEGVGIDIDAGAARLAARTHAERGLDGRAHIVHTDVREAAGDASGPFAEPFDFALLANVLYYLPMTERVPLLRTVARLLSPGGVLFVVTTVAAPQFFSRHFDLLLRAQEGQMELSTADDLVQQLTEAGLRPDRPRPIAPGAPVVTVAATMPG
jgi:SAM-dependent methyltransferase